MIINAKIKKTFDKTITGTLSSEFYKTLVITLKTLGILLLKYK